MNDRRLATGDQPKIVIRNLCVNFKDLEILKGINLTISANTIVGIIGPAHSGKTTLLRTLNRLDAEKADFRRTGDVLFDGREVRQYELAQLRRRIGLIFATPLPLPGSIFANITYGPRLKGVVRRTELLAITERCLRAAFLWDEVKDRLETSALRLSGGQQQRLCIARTLALNPEVIMMDEPCSGLDPISTAQIESAMRELKKQYTFVLVTNNTKQAARVADVTAFFLSGELVEAGPSEQIFTKPRDQRTEDYITGKIG
jgi:phosphate transport system ATP-binding protein